MSGVAVLGARHGVVRGATPFAGLPRPDGVLRRQGGIASSDVCDGDRCHVGGSAGSDWLSGDDADVFSGPECWLSFDVRIGKVSVDLGRLLSRFALTALFAWATFVVVAGFLAVSNEPIVPGGLLLGG